MSTWTSPEPQMQEDGEEGKSPERVERDPLRALLHVVQGLLDVALLKYPLSQRSQVNPSKENPAVHAQVSSGRVAKGGVQVQEEEEEEGADLPIGQAVHLSTAAVLNLPCSQSSQLVLVEYLPGVHVVQVEEAAVE